MIKSISKLLILVFTLLNTSCSIIDEKPLDSISISSYKDAEATIIGAYSVLTNNNLYGRLRVIVPELSAKNITNISSQFEFAHFSNNNITAENILLPLLWAENYRGIMRTNQAIANIANLDTKNQTLAQPLLGEAYFLRAFFYFDLVRMFGDIPLMLMPTIDINLDELRLPRSPISNVYEQIVLDLTNAERLLPDSYPASVRIQNKVRATKMAAKAYLAKVYLYQKQYEKCLNKLNEVLANTGFNLVDLDLLYNTTDNQEVIFAVFLSLDGVSTQFLPTISPYNATGTYLVSSNLRGLFEPQDRRFGNIIQSGNNWFAAKAKRIRLSPADAVYCLRVAELQLIMSEALARIAGMPTQQALNALNLVRRRAGLADRQLNNFSDLDSFLVEVLIEKRKELMFETGDFWFDAIRAGYAERLLGVRNPNAYLYPIPNSEIIRNPKLTQNAGY